MYLVDIGKAMSGTLKPQTHGQMSNPSSAPPIDVDRVCKKKKKKRQLQLSLPLPPDISCSLQKLARPVFLDLDLD